MDINESNFYKSYIDESNFMNSYVYRFNTIIDSEIIKLKCYAEAQEEWLKELFSEEQISKIKDEEAWIDHSIKREVSPYIFRSFTFIWWSRTGNHGHI